MNIISNDFISYNSILKYFEAFWLFHHKIEKMSSRRRESAKLKDQSPAKKYTWIGEALKEDKTAVYYGALDVQFPPSHSFIIQLGDSVLFHSNSEVPFIGLIDELYESKHNNRKYVKATWFFRPNDAKIYLPHSLDKLEIHKNEVFTSTYHDINDTDSILQPCNILYGNIEEATSPASRNISAKDTFYCRYKFDATKGILPISKTDLLALNKGKELRANFLESLKASAANSEMELRSTRRSSARRDSSADVTYINDDEDEDEDEDDSSIRRRSVRSQRRSSKVCIVNLLLLASLIFPIP